MGGARVAAIFYMAALRKIIVYIKNTLFKKTLSYFFTQDLLINIILHLAHLKRCAARAPPTTHSVNMPFKLYKA